MPSIRENLQIVRERIAGAALRAGRNPAEVRLLAVSKTFPAADIREAFACGQLEFGENRVQELEEKRAAFTGMPEPRWHLIGHIQTNKAAKAAALADCIHSIDSVRLIEKLDRAAEKRIDVLLELNLSGEESKTGMTGGFDGFRTLADAVLRTEHLHLCGLMTMAAPDAGEKAIRAVFAGARSIRDRAEEAYGMRFPELSMGMSGDFEYAIAEGATIVRIGTAIFGGRTYPA